MAYEYDRFEREDGGGSFLMGLLAGTVLGAGLGMLFAPKAGTELRSKLTESAGRLRTTAEGTYEQASEKVHQMVDRGREAYDRARSTVGSTAEEAGEHLQSGVGSLGNTSTGGSMSGAGTGTFPPNRNS
jgi:gas vesicle protein